MVRELPAGGESDVLLVSDTNAVLWVVKQYRKVGWSADEEVIAKLRTARAGHTLTTWRTDSIGRHLIWLQDWGTDPESGLFYEIQEYLPHGSLQDTTTTWDPTKLVGALADTVSTFHTVVGAHRDIKPGNVLIRSWDGPILVLGDVGLARVVGEDSTRWTGRDGTAAYQSPEASHGEVRRPGDWWAVGMLIAHTVLGHHPLSLPDGRLPSEQVILTHLARDIDLTGITDPRLRLLCEGLLTLDADKRWGIDQIRAWQQGQSPLTGYGTTRVPGRVRSVRFNKTEYATPETLAAAFAADPERAGTQLFQEKDPVLVGDLRPMLRTAGLQEADLLVAGHKSGSWEQTFLRLLAEMDPYLAPALAGQDMTPTGIGTLAQDIITTAAATPKQRLALKWVTDHQLWHWWRTLPGMGQATQAEDRLTQLADPDTLLRTAGLQDPTGRWNHLILHHTGHVSWTPTSPPPLEGRDLLDPDTAARYWRESAPIRTAWRILLATDPTQATTTLTTYLHHHTPQLPHQTWWTTLTNGDHTQQLAAATLTGLAHTAENQYERIIEAEARAKEA